ncbi:MAG TPA: hypothetical protein VLH56_15055 [Dissulfurispiraceae bacterium]|nr:hypothetical protein [Dissulfurispiraceae bacterium]
MHDTLNNLAGKTVGLLRADSGFYRTSILEHLENMPRPIPYIIAVRLHAPAQRMLVAAHRQWFHVGDGIEAASVPYAAGGWNKERRMVMVRQQIIWRPKATGKT